MEGYKIRWTRHVMQEELVTGSDFHAGLVGRHSYPSTLPSLSLSWQGSVSTETCHVPALSHYEGTAHSFCDVAGPAWLYPKWGGSQLNSVLDVKAGRRERCIAWELSANSIQGILGAAAVHPPLPPMKPGDASGSWAANCKGRKWCLLQLLT